MKKIIWVFLAVALCACSENSKKSTKTENEYTNKSNTEQQTAVKQESITMHKKSAELSVYSHFEVFGATYRLNNQKPAP